MTATAPENAMRGLVLLWVVVLCAVDLTVKYLVATYLMNPPRILAVAPFFNLILVFNPGISFGLFSETMALSPRLFAALQGLIVLALVLWAIVSKTVAERVAIATVAGGASGNVVDRFWNSSVTDYLDFHAFGWSWPAFNLADVLIVSGTLMLVVVSMRKENNAIATREP